jgi:hypothetical protein
LTYKQQQQQQGKQSIYLLVVLFIRQFLEYSCLILALAAVGIITDAPQHFDKK